VRVTFAVFRRLKYNIIIFRDPARHGLNNNDYDNIINRAGYYSHYNNYNICACEPTLGDFGTWRMNETHIKKYIVDGHHYSLVTIV